MTVPHIILVRAALTSAADTHGPGPHSPEEKDNYFDSDWLVQIEDCPLTRAQINRVGRREGTIFLPGMRRAFYEGGDWRVEAYPPFPNR